MYLQVRAQIQIEDSNRASKIFLSLALQLSNLLEYILNLPIFETRAQKKVPTKNVVWGIGDAEGSKCTKFWMHDLNLQFGFGL